MEKSLKRSMIVLAILILAVTIGLDYITKQIVLPLWIRIFIFIIMSISIIGLTSVYLTYNGESEDEDD